ncbi:MAG: lysophospholipase [Lachnospiraceae bacterium]|nr:lysophospholipase [Lachnospiraceae bacterium]
MAANSFPVTSDSHDKFNAFKDVPKIEIPVVFLVGKYDYTCHFLLQQQYYEALEAPDKEIYIFENSAHSPLYEESDVAKRVLEEIKNKIQFKISK